MASIPSPRGWLRQRQDKAERDYEKATQDYIPGLDPEAPQPPAGREIPAFRSPADFMRQKSEPRPVPQPAPSSLAPPIDTAAGPLGTQLAQDEALKSFSQGKRYAMAADALRTSVPPVGDQRRNKADRDTWTANFNQKKALVEGILSGKVDPSQLTPQEIPWGVFNMVAKSQSGPFAADNTWFNLDALGTIDPEKAKSYLVQMSKATASKGFGAGQQSLSAPSFGGGIAQGTQAGFSLGATPVAPGRTFGEKAGQFVGGVLGFLPQMFGMGAGPQGAVPAAGAAAEHAVASVFPKLTAAAAGGNILAKAIHGAIRSAATGTAIGAEGEGMAAATVPTYTGEGALGRIAGRAATFGAFGAAGPVSESIMGRVGGALTRSANPVVAGAVNLAGRAPEVVRHIGAETVKGGLSGAQVGLARAPLDAITDPNARDLSSFVRSVISNAGENAAEDAMMAIAMGIASGKIAPNRSNILKASKVMAEMRPPSDVRATGTDQNTADYQAAAQKLLDDYTKTESGLADERMAQEIRARAEGAQPAGPEAAATPQPPVVQTLQELAQNELKHMTEFLSGGMTDPASLALARQKAEELLRSDPESALSRASREPLPGSPQTAPQAQSNGDTVAAKMAYLRDYAVSMPEHLKRIPGRPEDQAARALGYESAEAFVRESGPVPDGSPAPVQTPTPVQSPPLDPPQGANAEQTPIEQSPITQQRQQESEQIAEEQASRQAGQQRKAQETQAQLNAGKAAVQTILPIFQNRPDLQAVLEGRAASAPLLNFPQRLTLQREQSWALDQLEQATNGLWQVKDGNLVYQGPVETSTKTPPATNQSGAPAPVLPAPGPQGPVPIAQPVRSPQDAPVHNQTGSTPPVKVRAGAKVQVAGREGVFEIQAVVDKDFVRLRQSGVKGARAFKARRADLRSNEGQPSQPEAPSPTEPDPFAALDSTARRSQYDAELADIQQGREKAQTTRNTGMQGIATRLAKDTTTANEQARKEFWQRIKQHGLIRVFQNGQLREDLTNRIPSFLKNNKSGRPLDEIASDMGYESDEALVRDIEAFARMGKVTTQDVMSEAEALWDYSEAGTNTKTELEYYDSAEAEVRKAIAEAEGQVSATQQTGTDPGAQPGGVGEEVPGDGAAGGPQGVREGAAGFDASNQTAQPDELAPTQTADHPMLDQVAQEAGFKDAAEARETVRAANAGDAAAEQRLTSLEPAVRQLFDSQTTDTSGAEQVVASRQRQLQARGMPAADAERIAQGSAKLNDAEFKSLVDFSMQSGGGRADPAAQTFRPSQVKTDTAPSDQSAFAVEGDAGAAPGSAAGYAAKVTERLGQAPNRAWKDVPETGRVGGRENAGAPPWFRGVKDMFRLLSENMRLAKSGAKHRNWYEDNAQQILKLTGSPEEADKFFKLVAIYSPKTPWSENVLRAHRAYLIAKESAHLPPGDRPPIQGIGLGWQDRAATEMMNNGKDWSGVKTNSFYRNFKTAIDPQADPDGVTVDVWMQAVNGFPAGPDGTMHGPTDAQYRFTADTIRRVAKELGWTPRQAQAAIWVAARSEAMGYPLTESGISVDTIIKGRAKANMSVPLLPDQSSGILPGIHNATPEQQQEYSSAVVTALHAQDGTFLPAQLAGVPIKGATLITGTAGGEQAPVLSLDVVAPRLGYGGFGVRPESTQALDRLGAVLGILTRQPSVSWTAPIQNTPKFQQNGVLVDIGREISGLELGKVGGMIGDATGLSPDQFALVNTPDGLMIYHTAGEGTTDRRLLMTANDRFYQGVKDAVAGAFGDDVTAQVGRFGAVANRIENDWGANQDGQGYRDRIPGAGSPAVQEGIRQLSEKLDGINQEFGQRYGWDQRQPAGTDAGTDGTQSESFRQAQSQVSASRMPDETAQPTQGGLSVDEAQRQERERLAAAQQPPDPGNGAAAVQTILPIFQNRPDLQAVLEGRAASAPLVNFPRGLTVQREQTRALDQLEQTTKGMWQVKDGNLIYQGTVGASAKTPPSTNQNGAPAPQVSVSGTTAPTVTPQAIKTPLNAPTQNQTAAQPNPPNAAAPRQGTPPASAPKPIEQALREARGSSKHNFEPTSLAERIKEAPDAIRKGLSEAPDAIRKGVDWYLEHFHDKNTPVNQVVKQAAKRAGVRELPTNQDPALMLELLPKTAPGAAQTYWKELRKVVEPVGAKLNDYYTYADAKVALWRSKQFGYGDDKLPAGMTLANAETIVKHFESGQDGNTFKTTFANEQKLFDQGMQDLVDNGFMTADQRDKIKAAHQDYAPWYRDPEAVKRETQRQAQEMGDGQGRTGVNLANPLVRQHGGNETLMDPTERRIRYFSRIAGIVERNKVGQSLVNLHEAWDPNNELMTKVAPPMEHVETRVDDVMAQLEDLGFDPNDLADPNGVIEFFKPKWAKDKNSSVVTVWRNGKAEHWNVHNEGVLRSVADVDQVTQNFLARGLQKAVDVYKLGATGTPSFTIANLIKDGWESWWLSKRQILPGHALFEAARLAANHDPFIKRVLDAGLKQGNFLSPERVSLNMAKDIADPRRVKLSARGLWNLYQEMREQPEFWTRLGESSLDYKARVKSGQGDSEAFLRALREGGRITLNFTRSGRTMREVNRYVPFAKIPFEAATRVGEAITEHPGVFLTKILTSAVAVGLASYLLGRDDPLKKEATDDERDRYFLVPMGKALVKVPKAQGVQGVLINLVERSMRAHDEEDPDAFKGFAKSTLSDLFPRVSNPAMEFLVAVSTGYSMADERSIVPMREQKLPKEQQYDERTSPTVRALSRGLPGALKSPRITQYAIDKLFPGYSEGAFKLENAFRSDDAPTRRIPGLPIGEDSIAIGRFISRPGQGKQGKSVGRFYDQLDQAEEVYNGLRDKIQRETGRAVVMNQLTPAQLQVRNRLIKEMPADQKQLFALRERLAKVEDRLSQVRRQLDAVRNDSSLAPDAKRREIERLNQLLTDMAQKSYASTGKQGRG